MSYYYNYYIGYIDDKTNMCVPLGPFDGDGKIVPVLSRSRSFASQLHDRFGTIAKDQFTEQLTKAFSWKTYNGEIKTDKVRYLPVSELPEGSFIKKGYFLIKDVERYEQEEDFFFDGFYEKLEPNIYAAKLQNEMILGKSAPKKDEEGGEFPNYSAADYMYYAYPDYHSEEYEAMIIETAAEGFRYKIPDNATLVVLETEG